MGNHTSKLLHDPEVKKQYLAVALIAMLMATFELVFYVVIIVPQVRGGVANLLRGANVGLPKDHPLRPYVRVPCALAAEREAELIHELNVAAKASGVLIILLPLLIVLALLGGSAPLRRESKKDVVFDVVMVFALLGAFQTFFYFFGQRFQYTSSPEMLQDFVEAYNASSGNTLDRPGGVPAPSPLTEAEKAELVRQAVSAYRQVASQRLAAESAASSEAERIDQAVRAAQFYEELSGIDRSMLPRYLVAASSMGTR